MPFFFLALILFTSEFFTRSLFFFPGGLFLGPDLFFGAAFFLACVITAGIYVFFTAETNHMPGMPFRLRALTASKIKQLRQCNKKLLLKSGAEKINSHTRDRVACPCAGAYHGIARLTSGPFKLSFMPCSDLKSFFVSFPVNGSGKAAANAKKYYMTIKEKSESLYQAFLAAWEQYAKIEKQHSTSKGFGELLSVPELKNAYQKWQFAVSEYYEFAKSIEHRDLGEEFKGK
jgi:hypothetical protein